MQRCRRCGEFAGSLARRHRQEEPCSKTPSPPSTSRSNLTQRWFSMRRPDERPATQGISKRICAGRDASPLLTSSSPAVQQFVRTADLDKIYAAAAGVLAKEKPASWKLKAFKYYYIPDPPYGLAGIVVEPTADLHRLQQEIIEAITPFTEKAGTPAAFMSTEDGRDLQHSLIEYVTNFVPKCSRTELLPAAWPGRWHRRLLNKMLAEPYPAFTFLPGRSVGLPAWNLRHRSQGTQAPAVHVLTRQSGSSSDYAAHSYFRSSFPTGACKPVGFITRLLQLPLRRS